eukprot:m.22771 g.22771  ORF g.22771 m.22771 type:complete len:115 (-) comp7436_c0_seq1:716-1060(-)
MTSGAPQHTYFFTQCRSVWIPRNHVFFTGLFLGFFLGLQHDGSMLNAMLISVVGFRCTLEFIRTAEEACLDIEEDVVNDRAAISLWLPCLTIPAGYVTCFFGLFVVQSLQDVIR